MSLLPYHKGTFWALHTLPTSCELFISTSAALTYKAYGSGGDGNAVGSAGRDTARRQRLHQNCEQEGAAFLIPSIFLTVFSLPCSQLDTSSITPLQTPSLVPQMPLEEGRQWCWAMLCLDHGEEGLEPAVPLCSACAISSRHVPGPREALGDEQHCNG